MPLSKFFGTKVFWAKFFSGTKELEKNLIYSLKRNKALINTGLFNQNSYKSSLVFLKNPNRILLHFRIWIFGLNLAIVTSSME
jgi:hypothetical protein